MNERDREFARQAWTENDWDGHVDIPKLIQLVRADEREECAKVAERFEPDEKTSYVTYASTAIRARGNT
jgi:hypothetical protein